MGLHDLDHGEISVESEPPSGPPAPPTYPGFTPIVPGRVEPPSRGETAVKFLAHGLALNVLMIIVVFLWVFLLLGLVICGYLLGLLIALIVLVIVYGYVNAWITRVLWFDVETGFLACFFHGLVLYIASLLPAAVIVVAGNLFPWTASGLEYHYLFVSAPLPNPVALVVALVIDFGLMGYLGRAVASIWKRAEPAPPELYADE